MVDQDRDTAQDLASQAREKASQQLESGVTAGWFGLVPSIVIGGAATLGVTAAWMAMFESLRRMDRFPKVQ